MIISTRLSHAEILALGSLQGIGNQSVKILAESKLTLEEIVYSSPEHLKKWIKGNNKVEAITSIKTLTQDFVEKYDQKLASLENDNIEVISFWDPDYPALYRLLKTPPSLIYIRGEKALLKSSKNIAIIGTRRNSAYAEKIASATANEFCHRDYLIVSGLAQGIDTAAHKGALRSSGKTAAILVDVLNIYPKENTQLAAEILQSGGILISENMPGEAFGRGAFVSRDRLQSGLSIGVFVIESGIKGGTMHTARFASEQSRLVFCPDYSLVDGYKYNPDQYSGIQKLLGSHEAKKYSGKDYNSIDENLRRQFDKLQSDISQVSLFG